MMTNKSSKQLSLRKNQTYNLNKKNCCKSDNLDQSRESIVQKSDSNLLRNDHTPHQHDKMHSLSYYLGNPNRDRLNQDSSHSSKQYKEYYSNRPSIPSYQPDREYNFQHPSNTRTSIECKLTKMSKFCTPSWLLRTHHNHHYHSAKISSNILCRQFRCSRNSIRYCSLYKLHY